MSLATNITNLATRVATEVKALRTLINGNAANLSALNTTAKTNLVAAINEVQGAIAGSSGINDSVTGTVSSWSSQKTRNEIDLAKTVIDDVTAASTKVYSSTKTNTAIAALIDDATAASTTVYSSTKTNTAISTAVAAVPALTTLIDDVTPSGSKVYSSTKVNSQIAALINDTTPSASKVYSSTKTAAEISAAVAALVNSAPAALDTLAELSTALGGDAAFATTTATALGNRVRYDSSQTLTAPQTLQARTNIAAAGSVDMGDPATDFVATFNAGLV